MSWSISATGADSASTLKELSAKLAESPYCPPEFQASIFKAAEQMAGAMTQPVRAASSSGHIGSDGKGYANVTVNAS